MEKLHIRFGLWFSVSGDKFSADVDPPEMCIYCISPWAIGLFNDLWRWGLLGHVMLLCCFWRHVSWDLLGLSRNEDLSGTWRLDSQFDSKLWGSSAFSNTSETGDSVLGDMSGWPEASWVSAEGWLEWSGADSAGSVQQAQRWSLYHLTT